MIAVKMENITKRFGDVIANDGVNLEVKKGEIHCLLGENGAGKTTLMKILFGLYAKDKGRIMIHGQEAKIAGPTDALRYNLGMIHQHFMLADRLTVAENIIAGQEPKRGRWWLDLDQAVGHLREVSQRYGLNIDPEARVEEISVGEQQRVEILKVLYRQADILIFDEPTAVLTPQEVSELFKIMRSLKADGKTIIFITHKLKETMAISDRITVLRDGKTVGTVDVDQTTPEELARMMVGREVVLRVDKGPKAQGEVVYEVKDLCAVNPRTNVQLDGINFTIRAGEILGVAGVDGNGQQELEEALMGLLPIRRGRILLNGTDITSLNTAQRRQRGIAHIPSDRLRRGLIPSFTIEENIILGSQWQAPFAKAGRLVHRRIQEYCRQAIEQFQIRCRSGRELARNLSGGNQQKVVIARELSRQPQMIIAAQPTRGVDVGAIEYIHNTLLAMREADKAILLISAELDEIRSLSDRILVLYEGRIVAEGRTEEFTESELGLLMAGHGRKDRAYGEAV